MNKILKKITLIVLVFLSIKLVANDINIAVELFDNQKKYKEAVEIFQSFPDSSEAQYYLGKAYLYGIGVEKDLPKAFEYAKKSANQNNSAGLNLLGVMYQYGESVEKDELQALMYYKQAANLGNTKAMINLGLSLTVGEIIKQDLKKSEKWFLKAYELGDIEASYKLAQLYSSSDLKKYDKAIPYYEVYSKTNPSNLDYIYEKLGDCYYSLKQFKKSYEYYLKAANLNNAFAMLNIYDYFRDMEYLVSKEKRIKWLEIAAIKLKDKWAISHYIYTNEIPLKDKIKNLTILYDRGDVRAGCQLAHYYSNPFNEDGKTTHELNYDKSFEIATNIISKDHIGDDVSSCYSSLVYLYRIGTYFSQDIQEAIKFNKIWFEKSEKFKSYPSLNLADIYLEELEDYDNAEKWYQITYDLTKDPKYLSIVDEYKKSKPIYTIDKSAEQQIFPILDNFSKKEQVFTFVESEKYGFLSINNKSIKMYGKESLELLKEFRSWNGDGVLGAFIAMAYDENNRLLYASTFNSDKYFSKNDIILAFDISTGKVVKTIKNKKAMKNTFLTISDDGKYLVALNNEELINIIDTNTNEIHHYNLQQFGKFHKAKIEKIDDDYKIYILSNDNQLFTFSLNQKRRLSKEPFINQISFSKKFNNKTNHSNSELEKIFKHQPMNLENVFLDDQLLNIKSNLKNFNFDFKNLKLQNVTNFKETKDNKSSLKIVPKYNNRILEVYNDKNELLSEISLLYVNALKYKVLDNKYILVVTSDITHMVIFTKDGRPIVNLQGFKSLQTHLTYNDGILTSFGDDNVVNIFNLRNIDKYFKIEQKYNQEILQGFAKLFGGNPLDILKESDEELTKTFAFGKNNFGFTPTAKQFKSYFNMFVLEKEEIKPIASLYIKNEKDWIIYTLEGLFTYGGDGKDLLKYHQNQGLYKEAKIIENEKIFDKFYRPDLIKKILAGEKVDIPLDIKAVIQNIKPPKLRILSNKLLENEKDIDLTYQICDAGNGIADPKLIINGQAINPPTSRGFSINKVEVKGDKCKIYRSTHTLNPGKNTISLKAYDKDKNIANESNAIEVRADYKIEEKPNLYFLSIAVSDYEDDSLDLKYPVRDVETVKSKIQRQSKTIYENIFTYELHDAKVTKEKIEKTFDEISQKIKINDAFVLYIAGHGISKDGLYQFVPHNSNEKISIDDIKTNLSKIPTTKSLVLLDTCQSGAAIESIDTEATKNRLAHDSTINYIVASSSDQVALEGYKDHGVFTYSVLDAFDKAYFPGENELYVNSLGKYVTRQVPKLTKKYFHFEQIPQFQDGNDFIIGGKN